MRADLVAACSVAQRTRAIDVRMALGTSRGLVLRMVLGQAASPVTLGFVIGGVAAWNLQTMASAFLFRVDAGDTRATVDPVEALRAE